MGKNFSVPINSTSMVSPTARVAKDVSGISRTVASKFWTKLPLGKCTPRILGIWSSTITRPIPALKPTSTGSEMKLAMNPIRRTEANTRKPPTSRVNIIAALSSAVALPPGATSPSSLRSEWQELWLCLR